MTAEAPGDDLYQKAMSLRSEAARSSLWRLIKGSSGDLKDYPTQEELSRMREHDEFTLASEKRKIAISLLREFATGFKLILICFLALSAYWVTRLIVADPKWITDHLAIQEILKTGWTIIGTVIATKFSNQIFEDKKSN